MQITQTVKTNKPTPATLPPQIAREYIEDMLKELQLIADAQDLKDVSILLNMTLRLMSFHSPELSEKL